MVVVILALKRIEEALHRGIVIGASCPAHTLLDSAHRAELHKCNRSELRALVGMEDQAAVRMFFCKGLLQGFNSKVGINTVAVEGRNNGSVVKVENAAVVPHLSIAIRQIGKIAAPNLVLFICMEILIQEVGEYLVRPTVVELISALSPRNRGQTELIHVLKYRLVAVGKGVFLSLFQQELHHTGAGNTLSFMINLNHSPEHQCFGSSGFCFSVFQVVVIRIGEYIEAAKQPARAELFVVVLDELVLT